MIELTIDDQKITTTRGLTVLQAAREAGIEIPSLCYLEGFTHFTSCMVCMVRDKKQDRLLPACSVPAAPGMEIDTSSAEVLESRRTALELLLAEHSGDCIAPCTRACPLGLPIPALLAARDFENNTAHPPVDYPLVYQVCTLCSGPCEKSCTRGQLDSPVSVKALMRYLADNYCRQKNLTAGAGVPSEEEAALFLQKNKTLSPKGWCITSGRNTPEELVRRTRPGGEGPPQAVPPEGGLFSPLQAGAEALRCLDCGCKKSSGCSLRSFAEKYNAGSRRYTRTAPRTFSRHTNYPDLTFEPDKCIKCGKCVRILEKAGIQYGFTYLGRSHEVTIGIPFDKKELPPLGELAAVCSAACPTGALWIP